LLLLAAVILSIQVISGFRVDERHGISSCLRRGDEAEVTIRYFLSVAQERGSERERTFIVREKEEARREKEEASDGEGGTRKEQIEEEGITVPSFFGPTPAGFTNLADRTEFEGHCSNSSCHPEESLRRPPTFGDARSSTVANRLGQCFHKFPVPDI